MKLHNMPVFAYYQTEVLSLLDNTLDASHIAQPPGRAAFIK